jgi:hypothetical protein
MATKGIATTYTVPVAGVRRKKQVDLDGVTQEITAAAAINVEARRVNITGPASSTYAVTLAAPPASRLGEIMSIYMTSTTSTNAVTLALTNVAGGTAATSASFNAAAEELLLVAAIGKWIVQAELGVTLS